MIGCVRGTWEEGKREEREMIRGKKGPLGGEPRDETGGMDVDWSDSQGWGGTAGFLTLLWSVTG